MTNSERLKAFAGHIANFGWDPRGLRFFMQVHSGPDRLLELKTDRYARPIYMRKGSTDKDMFEQVIVRREYDIDLDFNPEIIVDCGANVGYAAIWFKKRFPDAKVISVEPEASNFEMLQRNTQGYSDVHRLQAGIWWRNARLVVEDYEPEPSHCAFMVREAADDEPDAIEAVSISDIIGRFDLPRIDLLKMDIEGSEKEVFSQGFEQWLPKVRVLVVELHDRMKPGCSQAFFSALQGYDYSTEVSGENIVVFFNRK